MVPGETEAVVFVNVVTVNDPLPPAEGCTDHDPKGGAGESGSRP
jgi:hypothetical protein